MPLDRDDAGRQITYQLDHDARLVAVGGDWERFAVANGAPELLPPTPIGRRIASFIADATTEQLYSDLYAKVQRTGVPLTFPLRCDAPDIVRELRMTIATRGDGFFVTSDLVSEERRSPLLFPIAAASGAESVIHSCGWCKRIDVAGEWLEIEVAVHRLALLRQPRPPAITHGICRDCAERMEKLSQ